jgi:hypothetical protein
VLAVFPLLLAHCHLLTDVFLFTNGHYFSAVPLTISQVSVTEVSNSASTVDVQVTWSASPVLNISQQQYYQFWVQFRFASSEYWINVTVSYRTMQNVTMLPRGVSYVFRVVPVRVGVGIKNRDSSSAELTFMSSK